MHNRLFRSRNNSIIGGVCSGLGQYLGVDPTWVRLFFILLAINGIGVLIYFLLWIIMPLEGQTRDASLGDTVRSSSEEIAERARAVGDDLREIVRRPHPQAGMIIGGSLIFLGFFYLVRYLPIPWLNWLDFDYLWPLLLIFGGLALLLRRYRGG
jgi:phage shock protein PspC (stress-responsive transcriptional regulator)